MFIMISGTTALQRMSQPVIHLAAISFVLLVTIAQKELVLTGSHVQKAPTVPRQNYLQ